MRDLVFALAMLVLVPVALARPFNAYLLWVWTSTLIPTGFLYGFMVNARINFIFASLTILLVLIRRVEWSRYQFNPVVLLCLAFLLHATISWATAYPGNPVNNAYFDLLVKGLVICLLMPMFLHERWHMHAMLMAIVLGLGLHGVIEGLKTVVSGGAHNLFGPRGSMIQDRNHLSVALAMILPIVYYLFLYARERLIRFGFLAAFVLIIVAIIGGGSRGGFLTLAVVAMGLIFTTRYRWRTLLLVLMVGLLLVQFVPDSVVNRLETIKEADEDDSFMGRVIAWKISAAIALEHPFFGGGFRAVQVQYVWDMFKTAPSPLDFLDLPIPEMRALAAHSVFFEIMGDFGFLGLLIYLLIFVQPFLNRFAIKRMVAQLGPSFTWARDLADMLMLGVLAFLAGGSAVSLAYYEVTYMVIMLMAVLHIHVRTRYREAIRVRARGQGDLTIKV